MASHGLAQRLVEREMSELIGRNELCETGSEEDRIIKSWFAASNCHIFRKLDFFYLLRKTLLFVLTGSSLKDIKKKELLKVISIYFNTFSNALRNNMDVRKPVIDLVLEPWKNDYFSWDELFQRKISIRDQKVQEYFCAEPEEIVMARVHVFLKQGKEEMAMSVAKNSFLFHSRVAKHFSSKYQHHSNQKKNMLLSNKCKKGTASVDWYLFILQKKKNLPYIVDEMKQLLCHEGVLLVQRLRQNKKSQSFAFTLLQILFMQELIGQSKFCCTKKIFCLWCAMHKEKKTSMDVIIREIGKTVAAHAPSSAHFYLLVDALWKQFGSSFITVYVELYVRGLTVDINHLEAAKNREDHDEIVYLECHIASMFAKLSTLFSDFHEGAARECMFSAFSLKPTKERLYILQSLTHSILSTENEKKLKSSGSGNSATSEECECDVRCSGMCNNTEEHFLEHPILMKGFSNVPYSLVKDLVSVLEGVRCICFQYNLFDWRNNATDLGDYLKDFNMAKSWESDTEYASEGSMKSDVEENSPMTDSLYQSTQMDVGPVHKSMKRKSDSDDVKEMFSLDVGANIEVTNNEFGSKRIKVQDQNMNNEISKHDIFNASRKPAPKFTTSLGMEDAIENVIRMTLDNDRQQSDRPLNSGHNTLLSKPLNHANDGTEKLTLSSIYKPVSENHVYPYSLTTYGKKNNLNSSFKSIGCSSAVKSNIESTAKYASNFTPKPSSLSQALTAPVISRESVISPAMNKSMKLMTMQEDSCKQMAQNKFLSAKTMNAPCYSRSGDISMSAVNNSKKVPGYHHQEALNLGSKSSMYEQARNTSNTIAQNSQFISNQTTMQVLRKSDISTASDISKTQFLSNNTAIASSSSVTLPINVIQSKETVAAQHAGYPSSSHCVSKSSMYRTDSRYQVAKNSMSNTVMKRVEQSVACFQDNNFVHCDRSSVIQHTMQHVRESHMQSQSNDIEMPNQLSVSLNSNAIEQIRSVPKKDITNLPPFTVNVNDRAISNSSVAVSASLVIPRKPQTQIDLASQPVCNSIASINNNETITIPGILASQSVIVSPWEAQRKSHGELMYKKNINAINTSTMDKRIYKNRPPFGRPVVLKPEPKISGLKAPSDKINNNQLFKAPPSHINSPFLTLPSSNQNNANTSQVWSYVNNTSSQRVSPPTSSQPWYSEPYPKPYNSGNNAASKSSEGLNLTVQQSTSSVGKPMQLTKHAVGVKPLTLYSKPVHSGNNSSISSTVSYSPNNSVSSSSTTSSVLNNISIFSSPNSNPRVVSNENVLHKDFISAASPNVHPNNKVNIKTFRSGNNPVKNNSVESSVQQTSAMQLTTVSVHGKNSVQYTAPDLMTTNLHYSQVSSKDFSSCCSPTEVNPCQNCSLPAENNLARSSTEKHSDRLPEQMIPDSNKMVPDDEDLTSAALCDSKFLNKSSADGVAHSDSNVNSTITNCQYCLYPFLATELQMHILNSHSREYVAKSNTYNFAEMNSDIMTPENVCTKSLPLVPEQDSLFQKESFHSNLPQTKTFVNSVENQQSVAEGNKNLGQTKHITLDDVVDEHAFNACLDLIKYDSELKKIVEGMQSLAKIEGNNCLPCIPSNNPSNDFLPSNICNEVQEGFVSEAPVQNSALNDQSGQFHNFAECQQPELPSKIEVGKPSNSVFDFTEREFESSKPVQKLIHSKLQSSYSEKISTHTSSKTSGELSFAALSALLKVSITNDSANGVQSVEASIKDGQKDIPRTTGNPQKVDYELSCPFCSKKLKSAWSLKRHIKLHTNIPADNSQMITSPKLTDISSPNNMPDSTFPFENDIASGSGNSYNDSSDSLNHILQSNGKPNLEISSTSEMCIGLPKGRIKGFIKSPTSQCKFCGKVLTSVYMKKHIQKVHQVHLENTKRAENSSSDINMDVNLSSPSQVDSANIPVLSPLFEQDIDSSTCLSMSDALKRNNPYIVAETSNFSEGSEKLTENTDIKFNFNVLEFSKDTKLGSNVSTIEEDIAVKLRQSPPENISKFEENKIKCGIPCNDKTKFIRKQSCHVCSKTYTSISGLKRHLKRVHNLVVPRSGKNRSMNNSVVLEMKNAEEMQQLQSDVFNKVDDSDVGNAKTSNKETVQFSGAPPVENISASYLAANLEKKVRGERPKNLSPNANKSLLRAVLKSNFVSKQLEMKDWREPREVISHKNGSAIGNEKTNSCDTSGSEDRQYNTHLSATNCSHANSNYECLKGGTIDSGLKSSNKVCASVPFDSLSKTHLTESSKAYSYALMPDTKVYNHSSASSKFESSHLNKLHSTDEDVQMKYTTHTDSQNLSIQSNEISPISDIISNVSKCHFGGASNNDDKEYFEDNSLKLLIPENQDESVSSKNDESLHQSNIAELIQKDELLLGKESCMNVSDELDATFRKLNDLTVDEPRLAVNDPGLNVDEPGLTVDDPGLNVDEPGLTVDDPGLNVDEPGLTVNDPGLNVDEPGLTVDDPGLNVDEPGLTVDDPGLNVDEPGLTADDPGLNVDDPGFNVDDPGFNVDEQGLTVDDPDLNVDEPALIASEPNKNEDEILDNESCELGSIVQNSDESCTKCRLCQQNLSSMDFLSKHLKEVHNIPVLKKQISRPCSPEFSTCFQEPGKLSPPKLKLGTNESDSDSISDFDNPHSWSKTTNYSSEQDSSQNGALFENNLCVLLSPLSKRGDQDEETILQNSQSKLRKSFVRLELAEKEVELGQSDSLTLQPSNHLNSNSGFQSAAISSAKSKIRRHSFSDIYSIFNEDFNPLVENHLSFDLKQKSASLPNLKLSLHLQPPKHATQYTNHALEESKQIEHSAGENTTCSSVTDITEICKSSCDSSSSQNFPVQWRKILSSAISRNKSAKSREMSHKKILLRRLKCKSFNRERRGKERRNRSKCLSYHKKFKAEKTFKPIILTLKEATDISEFLKTHKQPTVKLIRLKEKNESDILLNQKRDSVSSIIYNKYNIKEAVVKLERMSIPSDIHDLVVIDQQLLVPNLLSQDTISSVTMQSHENQSPNGFYLDSSNADISHSEVSMMHENPPKKSIELSIINELDSNTTSSESVQFLGAVTREEKYSIKPDECCTSLKQCFVVLNRISV